MGLMAATVDGLRVRVDSRQFTVDSSQFTVQGSLGLMTVELYLSLLTVNC